MYFHIRISQKSNTKRDETRVDLSEDELYERYVRMYESGVPIIINGKTIPPNDIERIRISRSEQPSKVMIQRIKAEDRASQVVFLGGPSYDWQAADREEDITDQIILGPPGYKQDELLQSPHEGGVELSTKKIFVVHGHDHELKNDVEVFLTNVGLEPIVLHRQPDKGLTIIEKFEEYADVAYALVLLTPDDVGLEITELEKPEDERTYQPRARQNVIFELGYFVGKLGRPKVFYVYKEGVEIPSDIRGLIYKEVNDSIEEVGYALIKEFMTAGLTPVL